MYVCMIHINTHVNSMYTRLERMDRLASKVIDHLPDDGSSVFILMGDHGMSDSGDHGGFTSDETDTPLFIYTKDGNPFSDVDTTDRDQVIEEIDQLDIAPLLARIMDISIPHNSIGGFIDVPLDGSVMKSCSEATMKEMLRNALQVTRYWNLYSETATIEKKTIKEISINVKGMLRKAMDEHIRILESHGLVHNEISAVECDGLRENYKEIFVYSKRQARKFWTTFNNMNMVGGILVLIGVVCALSIYLYRNSRLLHWTSLPLFDKIMMTFIVFHTLTVFSNSFIEHEVDILLRMLTAAMAASMGHQFYLAFGKWEGTIEDGLVRKPVQWGNGWENTWSSLFLMFYSVISFRDLYNNKGHAKHWTDLNFSLLHAAYRSIFFTCLFIAVANAWWLVYNIGETIKGDIKTVFFGRDYDYAIRGKWIDLISLSLYFRGWILFIPLLDLLDNWEKIFGDINPAHEIFYWSCVGIAVSMIRSFLAPYPIPGLSPDVLFCHISAIISVLSGPLGPYQLCSGVLPTLASSRDSIVGSILNGFFVGRFMFLVSGHSYSFNTLQVEAGLVGLKEFDFVISGIQLAINTFGYDAVLFLAAVHRVTYDNLNHTILFALLHRTILLLGTCLSVYILQGHLMLWDIFAPRLIFEVGFFIVFVIMVFVVLVCSDIRHFCFKKKTRTN